MFSTKTRNCLLLFVVLALFSPALIADCVTCHDFSTQGNGWVMSPPPQCGANCDFASACGMNCAPGRPEPKYLESLHPGLFLQSENGHLFVAGVIEGSPAQTAGIRLGDEIISINGSRPGISCAAMTWESSAIPNKALLLVRTGQYIREVALSLLSIRALLDASWISDAHLVSNSNYVYGSYIFGLTWKQQGEDFIVSDVLRGSPAAAAGISIGDDILSIDHARIKSPNSEATLSRLSPKDHRTLLRIEIASGATHKSLILRSIGLSKAFEHIVPSPSITRKSGVLLGTL